VKTWHEVVDFMRRIIPVFALASLFVATQAAGDPIADALLKRAFDNYRAGSSTSTVTMTIHRPDWERTLSMKAWTRGDDDGLVRFIAPAKDSGNATLKLGNEAWVFDPKLNQVIPIRSRAHPSCGARL
jgi:outer membrane lipoprotein-sorting protein